jgi:hypothetical protein
MSINVLGYPLVSSSNFANANGYWEWESPVRLDKGHHTFMVTATSPTDPSYYASDSQVFEVTQEETEKKKKNKEEIVVSTIPETMPSILKENPLLFKEEHPTKEIPSAPTVLVFVKNPKKEVPAGDNLEFTVTITKPDAQQENVDVEYFVSSEKGNSIYSSAEKLVLTQKAIKFDKNVFISRLVKPGRYKILVKITSPKYISTGEDSFQVLEAPFIKLGGLIVTLSDIMKALSWILICLLILVLLFLILLGFEYYSANQALFYITGRYLREKGMLTKRKGVSQ